MTMYLRFFCTVVIVLVFVFSGRAQDAVPDTDYTQIGSPMPPLTFMEWVDTATTIPTARAGKRKTKNTAQLPGGGYYRLTNAASYNASGNIAVMIFSPECTHCNKTVAMLEDSIHLLLQTKVILLTTAKMQALIPYFAGSHTRAKPPYVHIGYDSSLFVPNTFLYQPLPQVNVYNRDRKLIKSFVSDVVADSLRAWVN